MKSKPGCLTPDVLERAKKIKLLAMDVDGVLTGGEIIILNSGEELKIWSVKDRMGFALLKSSGLPIRMAWVTARESQQVAERGKEIGVQFIFQKCMDKWKTLEHCAASLGIRPDEIAYIGDDYVDLTPLKNAGLAVCPPESPDLLKETCHYETQAGSGRGVAREVIEILLQAQGAWEKALSKFLVFMIAAAFALNLSGCYSTQKPPLDFSEKPDQWVEKFTITETSRGFPVWILNSEIAQVFNKKKKITLENIKIEFMNPTPVKKFNSQKSLMLAKKSMTQAARLTAPKGEVEMETRNLLAWGGVEVQSEDGTKLFAERLMYSTALQKITTESPIKIVKKDSILLGEGLEASPDLGTVKIFRHQASIYPKEIPQK